MAQHASRTSSSRTTQMDVSDPEVQEYLDAFARSLTAGDGRTIATMWGLPALVIGADMVQAVSSPNEVEAFFSGAKEQYNTRGISDTRAEIFGLEWIGDRIVVVDVRWPYLDASGNEIGAEASTYTLRRDDSGKLKMHVALMRGVLEE
jgi:hypothetical protein